MVNDTVSMREPRYFWRRGFAYLLDILLVSILTGFVLLGVLMVTGVNLGAGGFANSTNCAAAAIDYPLVERFEKIWPAKGAERRFYQLCHTTVLGFGEFDTFVGTVSTVDGAVTRNWTASFLVDKDGNVLPFQWPLDLSPPIIVLILAWFNAKGRRPPGKMLMSLAVRRQTGEVLTFGRAVAREAAKHIPYLVFFLIGVANWIIQPALMSDFDTLVTSLRDGTATTGGPMWLAIGLGVLTIGWYIGPFIFWRGQTWYDMIAGTKVIKVEPAIRRAPR